MDIDKDLYNLEYLFNIKYNLKSNLEYNRKSNLEYLEFNIYKMIEKNEKDTRVPRIKSGNFIYIVEVLDNKVTVYSNDVRQRVTYNKLNEDYFKCQ